MVYDHVGLGFWTMEGCADNLMDTDVAGEDHVTIVLILGAKGPNVIQFARPAPFFGKAADGSIVTSAVPAVLVFTFADLCVLVEEFFVIHHLNKIKRLTILSLYLPVFS